METSSRVVLVVGGVRGLGLAVARGLAARGDRVHLTWRGSADRADALADEFGGRVHRLDAADGAATRDLVTRVVAEDGRLDAAVSTVGDYREGPLAELAPEDLEHLWRSNVVTATALMAAARGPLRDAGGALLLFGCAGLAGLRARRDCAAYAATKSALLVLLRSFAVEEAAHGVRANMISPGLVPHDAAHASTLDPTVQAGIPAGRTGTLDEVAAAACFLLSDEAAHVTGTDLQLAGGWML